MDMLSSMFLIVATLFLAIFVALVFRWTMTSSRKAISNNISASNRGDREDSSSQLDTVSATAQRLQTTTTMTSSSAATTAVNAAVAAESPANNDEQSKIDDVTCRTTVSRRRSEIVIISDVERSSSSKHIVDSSSFSSSSSRDSAPATTVASQHHRDNIVVSASRESAVDRKERHDKIDAMSVQLQELKAELEREKELRATAEGWSAFLLRSLEAFVSARDAYDRRMSSLRRRESIESTSSGGSGYGAREKIAPFGSSTDHAVGEVTSSRPADGAVGSGREVGVSAMRSRFERKSSFVTDDGSEGNQSTLHRQLNDGATSLPDHERWYAGYKSQKRRNPDFCVTTQSPPVNQRPETEDEIADWERMVSYNEMVLRNKSTVAPESFSSKGRRSIKRTLPSSGQNQQTTVDLGALRAKYSGKSRQQQRRRRDENDDEDEREQLQPRLQTTADDESAQKKTSDAQREAAKTTEQSELRVDGEIEPAIDHPPQQQQQPTPQLTAQPKKQLLQQQQQQQQQQPPPPQRQQQLQPQPPQQDQTKSNERKLVAGEMQQTKSSTAGEIIGDDKLKPPARQQHPVSLPTAEVIDNAHGPPAVQQRSNHDLSTAQQLQQQQQQQAHPRTNEVKIEPSAKSEAENKETTNDERWKPVSVRERANSWRQSRHQVDSRHATFTSTSSASDGKVSSLQRAETTSGSPITPEVLRTAKAIAGNDVDSSTQQKVHRDGPAAAGVSSTVDNNSKVLAVESDLSQDDRRQKSNSWLGTLEASPDTVAKKTDVLANLHQTTTTTNATVTANSTEADADAAAASKSSLPLTTSADNGAATCSDDNGGHVESQFVSARPSLSCYEDVVFEPLKKVHDVRSRWERSHSSQQ